MSKTLRLLAALVLGGKVVSATIIVAVGTSDGLLLCEDRRLTMKSSTGQVAYADGAKAQQIGKFGFFAVTGDLSATFTNIVGRTTTTFDILKAIPAFFEAHDIQQFDEQTALEFEAQLRDQLSKAPVPSVRRQGERQPSTEVWLYWMDPTGQTRLFEVDITDGLRPQNNSAAASSTDASSSSRLLGHFISLNSFKTSRPLVRGRGVLGYSAIVGGSDPRLDDLRQDEELRPFVGRFIDASAIDSISATRALKRLIREISMRQNLISADGLDVGPESDCFVGTPDGIKLINQ